MRQAPPHAPCPPPRCLRRYCFNPITVYYCWSECGTAVETMVLHVTNTPWQEDICYVLPTQVCAGPAHTRALVLVWGLAMMRAVTARQTNRRKAVRGGWQNDSERLLSVTNAVGRGGGARLPIAGVLSGI